MHTINDRQLCITICSVEIQDCAQDETLCFKRPETMGITSAGLQMDSELDEKPILSFASAFSYLLDSVRAGDQESCLVVFVLDEFDCFTQHHIQI